MWSYFSSYSYIYSYIYSSISRVSHLPRRPEKRLHPPRVLSEETSHIVYIATVHHPQTVFPAVLANLAESVCVGRCVRERERERERVCVSVRYECIVS